MATDSPLNVEGARGFVLRWCAALDMHMESAELGEFLASAGLVFGFPHRLVRDRDEFEQWYDEVTTVFFDEVREVRGIEVELTSPLHAEVRARVNWQARTWDPPAPRSQWIGCDWVEELSVVLQDGAPKIRTRRLREPEPMPGSPRLYEVS
ncbi:nuclear transport factor 2 family protein [Saccharopolyspora erythraea]|uniref:hypothetical protein n=1 Tax=Saccharopolyspora erythraea TaxID=1836 RepID=UPI001BABCD35|nr:hypothetical protein [Saccharopolyspora erythraea]QUH02167.1 nuclear transport factor 2 family protein [Saccharopolyspora erythraea]